MGREGAEGPRGGLCSCPWDPAGIQPRGRSQSKNSLPLEAEHVETVLKV